MIITIEQKVLYGHVKVQLAGIVTNGELTLRQDSLDHDYHSEIHIDTLQAIEKVEALITEAKRQIQTRSPLDSAPRELCSTLI